ncbi:MAG: hypothetical protein J0I12_26765 [Candidatus Eremiobacteraeota bacterium]|nr:hypothetical protein [Candidatus Eremiobacteraeota bacterium]
MRLSVWQLSTVILLSVLLGQNLKTRPNQAEAASQDVFGSPQVAISSYKNQRGSFILWADGHISKVETPDTVVSTLAQCVAIPAGEDPPPTVTRDNSKPQGSPNVPVGMYQTGQGSYVLFADGSCKKPLGDAGAASASPNVRSTSFDGTSASRLSGDSSILCSHTGTTGYFNLTFNPPFKHPPTVTVNAMQHHFLAGVSGPPSVSGCPVWTIQMVTPGVWSDQNCQFTVTAVGE